VLSYCFVESPIPYRNMRLSLLHTNLTTVKLASPIVNAYPAGSLLQVSFEYLGSMQGEAINLSFNFSSATDLALVEIPPFNVSVAILPHNNLAAHLYTSQTY
jgi:hypothetical protein